MRSASRSASSLAKSKKQSDLSSDGWSEKDPILCLQKDRWESRRRSVFLVRFDVNDVHLQRIGFHDITSVFHIDFVSNCVFMII